MWVSCGSLEGFRCVRVGWQGHCGSHRLICDHYRGLCVSPLVSLGSCSSSSLHPLLLGNLLLNLVLLVNLWLGLYRLYGLYRLSGSCLLWEYNPLLKIYNKSSENLFQNSLLIPSKRTSVPVLRYALTIFLHWVLAFLSVHDCWKFHFSVLHFNDIDFGVKIGLLLWSFRVKLGP